MAGAAKSIAPTVKRRLAKLRLSVQYPGGRDRAPTRPQVRRWVRAACDKPAEITVRCVDSDEGRSLNRDYRGKDYATNVLSFPYDSVSHFDGVCGDLVLCLPVVQREAQEQNKSPEAHFAHLIVHGMLHLQGHDHETNRSDAERMEAIERKILEALGYPDPYG